MTSLFTGNHYYHQTLKSLITAFGAVFDGITIQKKNFDGSTQQDYIVPIDFAPKNKWLLMVSERPDFTTTQVQMTLPRLAFEIVEMRPNLDRKLGFNGTFSIASMNSGGRTKSFNPAPWDLTFNLYSITKDNDDTYQIIEQIIPYFTPTLTVNVKLLPELNINKDIPITLLSVQTEDSYTGSVDEQRTVMTTFTFNVQTYFFGPIPGAGKVITDVIVNVTGDVKETLETVASPLTISTTTTITPTTKLTIV